jgi:hypothetical protein
MTDMVRNVLSFINDKALSNPLYRKVFKRYLELSQIGYPIIREFLMARLEKSEEEVNLLLSEVYARDEGEASFKETSN